MRLKKNLLKISFADFNNIVDFLKEKYDFDLDVFAFSITKNRIDKFSENYNIKKFETLINYLSKSTFFDIFLSYLAIPTTEIFRDPEFWIHLQNKFLLKNQGSKLKILVPDVTDDDELISLLILLFENKLIDNSHIIVSSFIPGIQKRIEEYKIPKKKYEYSLTNIKNILLKNDLEYYFVKEKNYYNPQNFLFKNIQYETIRLWRDGEKFENENFDFILSRNRLLYYKKDIKIKILESFYKSLKNKGALFIGVKEKIEKSKENYNFTLFEKKCSIYIKK